MAGSLNAATNNPALALGVGMKGNMHGDAFFLASFLARPADYADDIERRAGRSPRRVETLRIVAGVFEARGLQFAASQVWRAIAP